MTEDNLKIINVLDHINPSFYSFWLSDEPYCILLGGRSSFKSSTIALRLVVDFLDDPLGNVIVFRKVASSLAMSVYEQIKWAIELLGVSGQFKFYKAPLKIVHRITGTAFYFSGADDYQKIKGLKIAVGYIIRGWFEEANDFTIDDLDQIKVTITRQKLPDGRLVRLFYSYNPPKNPYDEFNEWVDSVKGEKDYFFHHSTYLDDELGFLSDQILADIERYKRNDYNYYRWLFLGEVIGLGNNVYNTNLFKLIDQVPADDPIIYLYYSVDVGHQTSATTCLCLGLTAQGKVILLNTHYYSPANDVRKKAPSELTDDVYEFMKETANDERWEYATVANETIDSADGGLRNQMLLQYGRNFNPVGKLKKVDMIDYVLDLLAQGRVYVLDIPENKIFMEEHRKYQWDEKTVHTDDPKVVKTDDHTVDAFIYFAVDNRRDLNLKAY